MYLYFSFDSRDVHYSKGDHRAEVDVLGDRAYFTTYSNPPKLSIQDVSEDDAGFYICRVDLSTGPTQYTKINLTIISKYCQFP